ncbi:MAG: histidine--tRNA ligase [Candidatus Bathyarchaeia archaeon]
MPEAKFTVPRGMRDIEPKEFGKYLWVKEKISEIFRKYGFQMMEPSTIENLETLEAKCGPDIKEEIYWFKDKAGRSLGLRFDLTVGMTRMVANRYDLLEPIKLCAIAGMWRYDEPQFARYRFFHQWDAEIYGSIEPEADAEVISLSMDILENVGLKEYEVKVSNRKLIEGFLRLLGINSTEKLESTFRIIDKITKIPKEEILKKFLELNFMESTVSKILEFTSIHGKLNKTIEEVPKELLKNDLCKKGYEELLGLIEVLEAFNKIDKCVLDLSIVRGIGYYDGIIFEAYEKSGKDIGAVLGGGRYDKLCKILGKKDMPATGVAGGIERMMISLERLGILQSISQIPEVFLAAVDENSRKKLWRIVNELRNEGISVDFDLKRRTLKKQMEYVNSLGIRYVVIIGPKEIEKGTIRLRDMNKHEESELNLEELKEKILKNRFTK